MTSAPPQGFIDATIERRLDIVDDLAVFWLRPEDPMTFALGQYVTLAVTDANGQVIKRATPSSVPRTSRSSSWWWRA